VLYRHFTGWAEENKEHLFGIEDLGVEIMTQDTAEYKGNSTFGRQ